MPDFAIKVLFYNSKGAFAADGCIEFHGDEISISTGPNTINVRVESVPLKNGVYAIAFNLMDRSGDLIVWSYKEQIIHVEGAYVGGISDCQLQLQIQERP